MAAFQPKTNKNGIPLVSSLDAINTDAATLQRRYVRVIRREPNGLVVFEFSVGWPDMGAELVLPEPLFEEFCLKNQVEILTEAVGDKLGENHVEY